MRGDCRTHNSLTELIQFHKFSPIQPFREYLTSSCFQVSRSPDPDPGREVCLDPASCVVNQSTNKAKQETNSTLVTSGTKSETSKKN